jgi:1-aminocyclopropane-1-carboxylate deaminase/D-cysteine desulfhydrase-like pyridoxal-dependent ACC family enzyme
MGATVHVTKTAERAEREARVNAVADALWGAGRRPYVIGVGGSGVVGGVGQVLAGLEVAEQAGDHGVTFSAVVLPSATGGTQAGLLVGLEMAGLRARVVGFTVAAPAVELRATVETLARDLGALTGSSVDPARIELDDGERGDGYGMPTNAATEAARLLASTEGILVDPIYTAKALAGLIRGVRGRELRGMIVFWHAGGTPGLFEPVGGPDMANPGRVARGA